MELLRINQLENILKIKKINHKEEILKETTLKNAHVYCKINNLSGQITGPLIENFLKEKYNMEKNNSSSCTGDLCYHDDNYEIKTSLGGLENNKFNYVQIRLTQECKYLLMAYYLHNSNLQNFGELFVFKLDKNYIKNLILKYGSYAHGTTKNLGEITEEDLNDPENNKEYSLRPKFGDKCWNSLLEFRTYEFDNI